MADDFKRFTTGDRIRVTIDGTLTGITPSGALTIQYPSDLGTCETEVELEGTVPAVVVEHVTPTGWPPRRNDIWRDRDGDVYIGRAFASGPALFGVDGEHEAAHVLQQFGPLTLVHREGQDGELDRLRDGIRATVTAVQNDGFGMAAALGRLQRLADGAS